MKIVTVSLRDQRISPKKARLVIDMIRGKSAEEAQTLLNNLNKKAARLIKSLLLSGLDACKSKDYKPSDAYLSEAICQEGRKLKRHMTNARGRSREFTHRLAHLKITLSKIGSKEDKTEKYRPKADQPLAGKESHGTKS